MMFTRPFTIDVQSGLSALPPWAQLAYRQLRDRLQITPPDSARPRTVLITSALDGEGTTTTAVYLTLAYAEQDTGKGTLLIDASSEAPRLHDIFGVALTPGLCDYLVGASEADEVIRESSVRGARVLPAGDAILPLALHRERLVGLLQEQSTGYDMTIIDCPAVLQSTSGELLAGLVDGIVLVVRAQKTPRDTVAEAKRRLIGAGGRITGVVLHDYREYVPKFLRRQWSV